MEHPSVKHEWLREEETSGNVERQFQHIQGLWTEVIRMAKSVTGEKWKTAEVKGETATWVFNPKQIIGRTSIGAHLHLNYRVEGMSSTALIDTGSTVILVRPDIFQWAGETSRAKVAPTPVSGQLSPMVEGMSSTALIDTGSTVILVRPDIFQWAGETSRAKVAPTPVSGQLSPM
ncbi:UNVERIFIED_CONTAM: hypothetical protein FKN15_014165 [Acipenser sinensis]